MHIPAHVTHFMAKLLSPLFPLGEKSYETPYFNLSCVLCDFTEQLSYPK